jgi:cbb3-type cytochrome oxidase subunit 3
MFRNLLHEVTGIGIYQMFSLLVFTAFFVLIALWLFETKKEYIDEMSNKPLE